MDFYVKLKQLCSDHKLRAGGGKMLGLRLLACLVLAL